MSDSTLPSETKPTVLRHSVRANVLHMMSSQLVTWALATIAAIIIPRFLGPSTLGDLRLASSMWLMAGALIGLGTSAFLQLEVARSQQEGLVLIGPILIIRTIAFGVCAIALGAYTMLTASTHEFVVIVALIGIGTLLGQWSDAFGTSFVGLEHMSTTAFASAATKFVNFVAILAVLILGAGVVGIVAVGVVSTLWGLMYLAVKFRRVSRVTLTGWRPLARYALRGSAVFIPTGVALIVYQQIDIVVISWVAESDDLGWYGAADALFGSLLFPATIVMGAIFPTMGRLHKSDPEQLKALVRRTFSILAIVAVPIGLGTTLIGPDFAPLLYGEDFRETGISLAILGPVIVLTFGTILFGATALATERALLWAGVLFGAALLTVPLDILLVPWANDRFGNGAIGGALAYVVTETIQFTIGIIVIVPYLATRAVAWRTLRILAAGAAMFAMGWPIRHLPFPVPVVVCSITYAILLLLFRVLGDEERQMVGGLLARLGLNNSWARGGGPAAN